MRTSPCFPLLIALSAMVYHKPSSAYAEIEGCPCDSDQSIDGPIAASRMSTPETIIDLEEEQTEMTLSYIETDDSFASCAQLCCGFSLFASAVTAIILVLVKAAV